MAQFGIPTRSATSDAAAGVVNPPAKRTVARTMSTQSSKTDTGEHSREASLTLVGDALGNAISGLLKEKTTAINSQRTLDASNRQGVKKAINEVDEVKKATGWEKFIFGENVEYRAAQQRAVQNTVQSTYLEEIARVDEHAGETPEQYNELQRKKNEEALAVYDGDKETRSLVEKSLAKTGEKLATAHYKAHYAYNQTQQRETERVRLRQEIDGLTLEAPTLMTTTAKEAQLTQITELFTGVGKPEGMTTEAHRALTLEVVKDSMTKGNSGPMLAIQHLGLDKQFSAAEQQQWDTALAKYDANYGQQADLLRTTADTKLAEALTPDEVDAAVAEKVTGMQDLQTKSSGTMQSALVLARGDLDAANDKKMLLRRDNALSEAGTKATSESDKRVIAQMGIISEDMKQAIGLAKTPEEQQAAIDNYNAHVSELVPQLSPDVAQVLRKEKLDTAATNAQRALNKEQARLQAAADKKKLKLADKAARNASIAEYFQTAEPSRKAAIQRDEALTKKEKEDGFDTHLVTGAQKFTGGELPPTAEEFGKALQSNPQLQTWVLSEMKRTGETSPMVKTLLTTATQSTDRLYDENGNVTQVGKDTVQMVDKLLQSDKGVDLIGGKDANRQWRITSIGVKAGAGHDQTAKKLVKYDANKGKADAAGFTWKSIIGDTSRRSWMSAKLQKLGIRRPSAQMITDSLNDYKEDLVAFGYDTKEADNSLWQVMQNNTTKIFSSNLHNAGYLNEATKYKVEDFISVAEKGNYLAGKYADLTGTNDVIHSHAQIPNLTWYTKAGKAGLFASSPSSNNEMFISVAEMQAIEQDIVQKEEIEKATNARRTAYHAQAIPERAMEMTGTQ